MRFVGACPSSTTWFAASAAEPVGVIDLELIGIVWIRIFEAFLVMVCLVTAQSIREAASDAGWSLVSRRTMTASAWVIAVGSVGGFASKTLWLEISALWAVLITFLASGLIVEAIEEHPVRQGMSVEPSGTHKGTGMEAGSGGPPMIRGADSWLALVAGAVLGGSAFYGRSVLLGTDIILLGWLASRRPIPVVWTSLFGVAAGLVGGGLVTLDRAPVTIAVLAIGILWFALVLRRMARGAEARAIRPTARS